jgi:hypothetical protein
MDIECSEQQCRAMLPVSYPLFIGYQGRTAKLFGNTADPTRTSHNRSR